MRRLASSVIFSIEIELGTTTVIDLVADGHVPAEAAILDVNYTGDGKLLALELHGNRPVRDPISRTLKIFAAPWWKRETPPGTRSRVDVRVTWIARGDQSIGYEHLVDAGRAFAAGRLTGIVLPAHIAVEVTLAPVLYDAARSLPQLLRRRELVSYQRQLDSGAPALASVVDARPMSAKLHGALDRLRVLRNRIGHEGGLDGSFTRHDAAEALTASILGYHYARHLSACVARARQEARLAQL